MPVRLGFGPAIFLFTSVTVKYVVMRGERWGGGGVAPRCSAKAECNIITE